VAKGGVTFIYSTEFLTCIRHLLRPANYKELFNLRHDFGMLLSEYLVYASGDSS
jgi:hypothetical protein